MLEAAAATGNLHLAQAELERVRAILAEHLPGRKVWAFGSRATSSRMLKRFSDLDLAVEGELTSLERVNLADAFDEAPIAINVDVVELAQVDAEFRDRIAKDFVIVQ